MGEHEAEGFFPERMALRAMRQRPVVDGPDDRSDALTRRVAAWVTGSTAVFTPMVGIAPVFGWIPLRVSLQVILCAASFVLMVGAGLAAMTLCRAFRRANSLSS